MSRDAILATVFFIGLALGIAWGYIFALICITKGWCDGPM